MSRDVKGGMRREGRRIVDALLFADFVVLMALPINYAPVHEWAGIAAFVLVVIHVVVNRRKVAGLFRRHDLAACVNLIVELALLCGIVAMAASSLVLSEYAFAWLPAIPGASWARLAHLCASYWTFVLAFFHFGMHLREAFGKLSRNDAAKWAARVVFVVCLVYGGYSFAILGIWSYMTLQIPFAFVDPNVAMGLLQYASMAIALTGCGHYLACTLRKLS